MRLTNHFTPMENWPTRSFLNLRTLASKRNLAFIFVGAEKMPYLMTSQGDKLNKFERESLNGFDLETEWADFASLVRDPVEGSIVFHDRALRSLYEVTDGHPYFTKALCAKAFELALATRDGEISDAEVEKAAQRLLASLDTNAFAHYWRDGTRGDADEQEIASVKRCRTLVSWARTVRSGAQPTYEEIEERRYAHLRSGEVGKELDDFRRRGVFKEDNGEYSPTVELFGRWLRNGGFALLVDGHLGDELEEKRRLEEDAAYVQSEEIVALVDGWPTYQGHRFSEDRIRTWLNQVENNVERRHLFTLLQNIRFVTDQHIARSFRKFLREHTSEITRVRTAKEICTAKRCHCSTFLDGVAKSGAHYAVQFANASRIIQTNVVTMDQLTKQADNGGLDRISAVVLADDIIASGNSMIKSLNSYAENLLRLGIGSKIPLFICVFCATAEGDYESAKPSQPDVRRQ